MGTASTLAGSHCSCLVTIINGTQREIIQLPDLISIVVSKSSTEQHLFPSHPGSGLQPLWDPAPEAPKAGGETRVSQQQCLPHQFQVQCARVVSKGKDQVSSFCHTKGSSGT